jgi:hypothetical protein
MRHLVRLRHGGQVKPLFTVHAGEYLVGSYLEQTFRRINVWVPSRDVGVDLLVSDRRNRRALSVQVKFSKDFLPDMLAVFQKELRACGWFTIDRTKLRDSPADYWVFVLHGFAKRTNDFVIVPRRDLWRRLHSIHGSQKTIQSYLWVTETDCCWETRGLERKDQLRIIDNLYNVPKRDFTRWLNAWDPVKRLNR